jgi:hypothetical protein
MEIFILLYKGTIIDKFYISVLLIIENVNTYFTLKLQNIKMLETSLSLNA